MLLDVCSITMAAGACNRMPADMRPKACCKVGTLSVIATALNTYEAAGIRRHLVVVGRGAEEVMAEVTSRRRDVLFAYQSQPRGTGDAVRCAVELLAGIGPPEHVMITAGDKVIAPHVIRGLVESYAGSGDDLRLVVGRSADFRGSGRVIERDGRAVAIIEVPDIQVRRLAARLRSIPEGEFPRTVRALAALAAEYVPNPVKLAKCFPALSQLLAAAPEKDVVWQDVLAAARDVGTDFDLPSGRISIEEAAAAPWANLSVYIGRFEAVREAVEQLRSDNVQGEWYLTDIVQIIASKGGTVGLFHIWNPQEVMAFNTLEELEEVRRVYAIQSARAARYPTVEQWVNWLANQRQSGLALEAVRQLGREIGANRSCIIVRSPGSINLMGRHIDHQGGMCNLMAIDREIVIAASPREDDRVNLWNSDARDYPYRSFTISELTADIVWGDWLRTLDSQFLQRYLLKSAGDWVNYVKGAALRLQHRFPDRRLRGMDAFVCGNIPAAAGLNSSAALVVAAAEALVTINGLNVGVREFVDLCGEGEWFVGARSGGSDHAAVKFSRPNEVVVVSFFPFRILGHYPFPESCRLLVCYSGLSARNASNAQARINSRVACYHMARELIREQFPQFAMRIEHLRDISPTRLDISLPALYALLKRVPVRIGPDQVEALARRHPVVAKCLSGLDLAGQEYPLRDVALYGIAECERARRVGELLERGDLEGLGRMMNISHDGDRVAKWSPDQRPFDKCATDAFLDELIRRTSSLEALTASGAALWQQPGGYNCSTPEIDLMVDRATECPGVLGAQLAGAGLGGCIMILVRKDAAERVQEALVRGYYAPRGIEPQMFVCQPARGSQVLTAVESER